MQLFASTRENGSQRDATSLGHCNSALVVSKSQTTFDSYRQSPVPNSIALEEWVHLARYHSSLSGKLPLAVNFAHHDTLPFRMRRVLPLFNDTSTYTVFDADLYQYMIRCSGPFNVYAALGVAKLAWLSSHKIPFNMSAELLR